MQDRVSGWVGVALAKLKLAVPYPCLHVRLSDTERGEMSGFNQWSPSFFLQAQVETLVRQNLHQATKKLPPDQDSPPSRARLFQLFQTVKIPGIL